MRRLLRATGSAQPPLSPASLHLAAAAAYPAVITLHPVDVKDDAALAGAPSASYPAVITLHHDGKHSSSQAQRRTRGMPGVIIMHEMVVASPRRTRWMCSTQIVQIVCWRQAASVRSSSSLREGLFRAAAPL